MFTPTGYFAPTTAPGPNLPSVVNQFDFFYDAGSSTTWDDQSGNGNNGTVVNVGSGGTSTITHIGGATPYWEFRSPSPTVEMKYLETGVAPGALGTTTSFAYVCVFKDPDLTVNATLFWSLDTSFDLITSGTSRTDNKIFVNLRGGGFNNQMKSFSAISQNTWTMMIFMWDTSDTARRLYVNNALSDSESNINSLDLTDTINIGVPLLNSSTVNDQDIAAAGWVSGYALTAQDRQDLYDYYNNIYSF